MCGQVGLILGKKRRSQRELQALGKAFTQMLLLCERRGPYATGIALLKDDGFYHLFKRPLPAQEFVKEAIYQATLADLDNATTLLMGHTRLPTRGSHSDNRNNHPIRAGNIIGTHNGTIYNADRLFKKFRLPRFAEVDSEVIFRIADRSAVEGSIDFPRLKEALALCRGQMSAVLASQLDPGVVIVLKGNKPLHLAWNRAKRVMLYSSELDFITLAPEDPKGWSLLDIPRMTALTLRREDLGRVILQNFAFKAQKRNPKQSKGAIE